jgi:ElaB/YqjD/DUF883 family membrane-anchored ribosome-binding protein
MPNNNTSTSTPEKPRRASEGAAKIVDGAHEIASAAMDGVTDKGRQVRDQIEAGAASAQAKASGLASETAAAAEQVSERVESAARGVMSGAREAISDVKQEATALLHDAQDRVIDTYDSARDYALEVAHEANELAHRAGRGAVTYARRASTATGKFATVHALPLTALGASIGWLAWSVHTNARMEQQRSTREPRATARLAARPPPVPEPRDLSASHVARSPSSPTPPVAPTTSGAKLMGVPGRNPSYDY